MSIIVVEFVLVNSGKKENFPSMIKKVISFFTLSDVTLFCVLVYNGVLS